MTITARDLLVTLRSAGANLRLDNGTLRVRAPAGVITAELRIMIAERKPELVKLLTTYGCSVCEWGRFSEPTTCFHCRRLQPEMSQKAVIS